MNIDVLAPASQFALPSGHRTTAVAQLGQYVLVGTARGLVLVYNIALPQDPDLVATVGADSVRELVKASESQVVVMCGDTASLFRIHDEEFELVTVITKGATKAWLVHAHILVAFKKSFSVYNVDGDLVREVSLKEKVRAVSAYDSHVLLALSSGFAILSLDTFIMTRWDVYDSSLKLSYSYFGPSSWWLFVMKRQIILIQDALVWMMDESGKPFKRIDLDETPILASIISPIYLALVFAKGVQVYTAQGSRVQFVESLSLFCCASGDNTNLVVANALFFSFYTVISLEKQIEQCGQISGCLVQKPVQTPDNDLQVLGLEMACLILENSLADDSYFDGLVRKKFHALRGIQQRKAILLFTRYHRYHELLVKICSAWLVPVMEVLGLFPEYLNASSILCDLQLSKVNHTIANDSESVHTAHIDQKAAETCSDSTSSDDVGQRGKASLDRSPKGNVISVVSGEDAGPSDESHNNALSGTDTQTNVCRSTIPNLPEAINELIVYLTEQRRLHLTFLSDHYQTHSFNGLEVSANDLYDTPDLDLHLTKLVQVIDTGLFLCYYHAKPMLLGPLLRLPNKCDSVTVTRLLVTQPQLVSVLLDFYHARQLDTDAIRTLDEMARSPNHDQDQARELTVRYLQKLSNIKLDLVLDTTLTLMKEQPQDATEVGSRILMNDSTVCEAYDPEKVYAFVMSDPGNPKFAIKYLEWALLYNQTVQSRIRDSALHKQMYTSLAILYYKDDPKLALQFLKTSHEYDPWKVLKVVKEDDGDASLLRAAAVLHHRCGESRKALSIYYARLHDLECAMDFCADMDRFNLAAGQDMLHELLQLTLETQEKWPDAIKLLNRHGLKMNPISVLKSMPREMPLTRLHRFITSQIQREMGLAQDKAISANLHNLRMSRVCHEYTCHKAQSVTISSSHDLCGTCIQELGESVIAVLRGVPSHYKCLTK